MTCNKNPFWSVDYSQNKCIGFYYSSFFFHSLLSHSILLCFIFPFTLYSLNFSNVCMGFEKLSVYCPWLKCRHVLSNTKLLNIVTWVSDHFIMFMCTHKCKTWIWVKQNTRDSFCLPIVHVHVYMSIISLINIKYLNRSLKMMHVGTTIENNQYLTVWIWDFSWQKVNRLEIKLISHSFLLFAAAGFVLHSHHNMCRRWQNIIPDV